LALALVAGLLVTVAVVLASRPAQAPPAPRAAPTPRAERPSRTPAPAATPRPSPAPKPARPGPARPRYPERPSRARGSASAGRLVRGVKLPASGRDHVTYDPITHERPSRSWRRHGTDRLVRTLLRVLRAHRRANPGAPRVLVGDLSRPRGGDFGPRYGLPGHASHQNGLDADLYYPRRDRRLRVPTRPAQVDRRLAQDLVDRLVAAGAQFVFVGPSLGLTGPPAVVQPLPLHDNHIHVRLPAGT
jgi:hypothetical protein